MDKATARMLAAMLVIAFGPEPDKEWVRLLTRGLLGFDDAAEVRAYLDRIAARFTERGGDANSPP